MASNDYLNDLFGSFTGDKKYDKFGYHCTRCKYELDQVVVKTVLETKKKLFYCKNKNCLNFGFLTVVAIKKNKS